MNTITTSMKQIAVSFDDGEEITGRVEIKEMEVFDGSMKPQIVNIDLGDFEGNDDNTADDVKTAIVCSVNETFEPSWYSEIWGFEYTLS